MNFLKKIINKEDVIIVGVSGGPDSMCLLNLLYTLKEEYKLTIICAHVNHNVRIESQEESEFVSKVCQQYNCIFETIKLNFKTKKNFEEQARKKRYAFFKDLVKKYNANYLFTAHHGDDLTETILMRLTRGSLLKGYAGIKKITDDSNYKLIRPLLYTTKEEIEEYMNKNNLAYCKDVSNDDMHYTRNRFRKKILPVLKEENRNVHKKFLRFSEELQLIDGYLEKQTNTALTTVYSFGKVNLHEFNKLDLLIKKRVVEYILKEEYQEDINKINERHLNLVLDLCGTSKANATMNLPLKKEVVKSYGFLYFRDNKEPVSEEYILDECVKLNNKGSISKISSTNIKKSNFILRLDSKDIAFPLKVRTRKDSDRMEVKNLNGSKKLKEIFINEKIPLEERKKWPIVVDAKDNILWIPGLKKSKFDKNIDDFYDIIYKYVVSEEKQNEKK